MARVVLPLLFVSLFLARSIGFIVINQQRLFGRKFVQRSYTSNPCKNVIVNTNQRKFRSHYSRVLGSKHILRVNMNVGLGDSKDSSDTTQFNLFFNQLVPLGGVIGLDQLRGFPVIKELVADGLVFEDDLQDLWTSAVGDSEGLSIAEAFEFVCMVRDLPDPEDAEYFDTEFEKLAEGKEFVPFYKFLGWSGVQDVVQDSVLSMDEITEIYRVVAKDLNTSLTKKLFLAVNNAIDDAIEDKENATDFSESDNGIDLNELDIWSRDFDPVTAFDKSALEEVALFWKKNVNKKNMLEKAKFMKWSDVQDIIEEGVITMKDIEVAWNEASGGGKSIDYDKFLRLNIQIDLLLDKLDPEEQSDAVNEIEVTGSMNENQDFYESEYKKLVGASSFLTIEQLLGWNEMKELIQDGIISQKQVLALFNSFPRVENSVENGITKDNFIALNAMLDVLLDNSEADGSSSSSVSAVVPTLLGQEESRPMPAVGELTIGSLGGDLSSTDTDGESNPDDVEMMEAFDKADTLLNSGKFSDFDVLIGDENDPRLELKSKLASSEISPEVQGIRDKLLLLSKQQNRCGLEKPSEEEDAVLRNYVQTIIDKSAKISTRSIDELRSELTSGTWKLLFTNSEMFSFYNGITGFSNVFPGASFQDLSLEFTSDGYLSEAKYLENLNTPLGNTLATVFSNWDLMKETSFMTNEISVILRGYCTKVTAGPMTYSAEENWKSLRTMSMNEVVYIDDKLLLMRNAGALRVFFVYEKV